MDLKVTQRKSSAKYTMTTRNTAELPRNLEQAKRLHWITRLYLIFEKLIEIKDVLKGHKFIKFTLGKADELNFNHTWPHAT